MQFIAIGLSQDMFSEGQFKAGEFLVYFSQLLLPFFVEISAISAKTFVLLLEQRKLFRIEIRSFPFFINLPYLFEKRLV